MRVHLGPTMRALAVAATAVAISAAGLAAGVFGGFRLQASDALFPLGKTSPQVVVVGVNAASITQVGQKWPWPRDVQARVLAAIAAAKPKAVAVDIVYEPAADGDTALAAAIGAGPTVLAAAPQLSRSTVDRLYRAVTLTSPVAEVQGASGVIGHSAITPDPIDGVVRSLPLLVDGPEHEFLPALSLAAVAAAEGAGPTVILRPKGVQIGNRFVPTDHRGRLRVAYPDAIAGKQFVSAGDVLAGRVPASRFRNKIVLVGVTDPTLGDYHTTPVDKGVGAPGVLIHASAVNTMLSRNYLAVAGTTQTLLWLSAMAVLIALAASRLRLWAGGVAAVVSVVAYVAVAIVRFDSGTEMDLVWPLLAIALTFFGSLLVRVIVDARDRRRMTHALEQYIPADMARRIVARDRKRAHIDSGLITFLFTDVVGSTEAWENYPQVMGEAMRRHDQLVEEAVEGAGGALVRPRGEGDSRFAVFADPVQGAHAALSIDKAMRGEKWKTPSPVEVRMGIHTGEAELRDADYYGSSVNRCARIRGVAGPGEMMMSSVTADLVRSDLKGGTLEDFGLHTLKGMEQQEHVFALRPDR